ncbi:MAG: hypothetical protein HQL31_04715, partial [Planctomycetes bacterium]|nr:hypothetical protein [Planctomycetota bacterium]
MKRINKWLLDNRILIKDNPAVSMDMVLDAEGAVAVLRRDAQALARALGASPAGGEAQRIGGFTFHPRSRLELGAGELFLIEIDETGDCLLVTLAKAALPFEGVADLSLLRAVPLTWENLLRLKNALLEADPESTVFPVARSPLNHSSLGVGARRTTLPWPGVAWAMKQLKLPLTANQNSIPRELVYDLDAMLDGRLSEVPFIFIGRSIPEGHQGQSVQGMSHAAVITYLKLGFHQNRIPWGFNADHQPVGGVFDRIEEELVAGSILATYITFDLSPELMKGKILDEGAELEEAFEKTVEPALCAKISSRLEELAIAVDPLRLKQLLTYITPAMNKLRVRDGKYSAKRRETFSTEQGRRYYRELSVDELPGLTAPETLAVCLAMGEALGLPFEYAAPNFGFQKNTPYPD